MMDAISSVFSRQMQVIVSVFSQIVFQEHENIFCRHPMTTCSHFLNLQCLFFLLYFNTFFFLLNVYYVQILARSSFIDIDR